VFRTRAPLILPKDDAFDLHVLGTPPAFILSQDQTLRLYPKLTVRLVSVAPRSSFPSTSLLLSCLPLLSGGALS
jgi:hypothetical protein